MIYIIGITHAPFHKIMTKPKPKYLRHGGRSRLSKIAKAFTLTVEQAQSSQKFHALQSRIEALPPQEQSAVITLLANFALSVVAKVLDRSTYDTTFEALPLFVETSTEINSPSQALRENAFGQMFMMSVVYRLSYQNLADYLDLPVKLVKNWMAGQGISKIPHPSIKKLDILKGLCKRLFDERSLPHTPESTKLRHIIMEEDLYPSIRANSVDWYSWGKMVEKEPVNSYRMISAGLPPIEDIEESPLSVDMEELNTALQRSEINTLTRRKRIANQKARNKAKKFL